MRGCVQQSSTHMPTDERVLEGGVVAHSISRRISCSAWQFSVKFSVVSAREQKIEAVLAVFLTLLVT